MEGASSSGALPLPLLVHDLGTRSDDSQTQFSICNQALSAASIELLRDFRCFETPQGWVLTLNPASLQTFLWRPQDSKRIDLPTAKEDFPRSCKCLLSSNTTSSSSDCSILVLDLDTPKMLVCKIGGGEWDSFRYELSILGKNGKHLEVHMAKLQGIAAVAGKVYYTFSGHALGIIEFSPEVSLTTMVVDMVELPTNMPNFSTYLIESCGELFLVVVFFLGDNLHKIAEVAVYKMDFSGPEWCKVDGIGDRVFLLGGDFIGASNFGASCSASDHGLSGNCIYFVNNIAAEENFLHVIDLEKGNQEVLRPFRHKGYPLRPPFWLLATHG